MPSQPGLALHSLGYGQVAVEKRFWYHYHAPLFNNRFAGTTMKVKLVGVLLLTLILELACNFTTFANLETFFYFSSMLVHSPLIYCMKLAIRLFVVVVVAYINEYEVAMSPSTMLLIGTTVFFMQVIVSALSLIHI